MVIALKVLSYPFLSNTFLCNHLFYIMYTLLWLISRMLLFPRSNLNTKASNYVAWVICNIYEKQRWIHFVNLHWNMCRKTRIITYADINIELNFFIDKHRCPAAFFGAWICHVLQVEFECFVFRNVRDSVLLFDL